MKTVYFPVRFFVIRVEQMHHWIKQFSILTVVVWMAGCSGVGRYSPGSMKVRPAGVDSLVYQTVLKDSKILFVSQNNQSQADTLKKQGKIFFKRFLALDSLNMPEDASKTVESLRSQIQGLHVAPELRSRLGSILRNSNQQQIEKALSAIKLEILGESCELFETAYRLNPTDTEIMLYLSRIYHLFYAVDSKRTRSIEASNGLLRHILDYDRGDHFVYFLLAENERSRSEWKAAESHLLQSIDILQSFDFLPEDLNSTSFTPHTDSLAYYKYYYLLGDTYVKLYQADDAIRALNRAIEYTNKKPDQKRIRDYLKWIQWAEGDIRMRELFEEASQLEKDEKFLKAAEAYTRILPATKGKAQNAYWETAWRLSKIESAVLCNDSTYARNHPKKEIGLNRLRQVIHQIPKDSSGIPVDTMHLDYMNDYCRMLWNEASRLQKLEGKKKEAERLFSEGSAFPSDVQGKCSLQMTRLYQSARFLGLFWAIKTYTIRDQLNEDELRGLFVLFKTVTHVSRNPVLRNYFNLESHRILDRGRSRVLPIEDRLMAYEYLRSGYRYLSEMLYQQYHIRQDREPAKAFDRMYRDLERTIPVQTREKIRMEIYQYYYRAFRDSEYQTIIEDWKKQLRSLRIRDEMA